jgi:hypothetical protein
MLLILFLVPLSQNNPMDVDLGGLDDRRLTCLLWRLRLTINAPVVFFRPLLEIIII